MNDSYEEEITNLEFLEDKLGNTSNYSYEEDNNYIDLYYYFQGCWYLMEEF